MSCNEAVYQVDVHDVTQESRDDIRSAWRVQCSAVRPEVFVFEVNSTHDRMVRLTS